MALASYRDLAVWQRSMDLTVAVYDVTKVLPKDERYGLGSQLKRAAVSVPSKIAEGYGRTHRGEYLHHLSIARGSLSEVETLLAVAVRVGLVGRDETVEIWNTAQEVGKMLTKLMQSLNSDER